MTDEELKHLFEVMQQRNATAHEETRRLSAETADRLSVEDREFLQITAERLWSEIQTVAEGSAENRHFFQMTGESLRHEIQLVAVGVTQTREALDRESAEVREEVRRTAAETQAMIKLVTHDRDCSAVTGLRIIS